MLVKWADLPDEMRNDEVRKYYDMLSEKRISLVLKRIFDVAVSLLLLVILSPVFLLLAIAVKIDSPGPVFFRQVRVTQYGKEFKIFKFRTMVHNAEELGAQVTQKDDDRITRVGRIIRQYRLDEISQLINVARGTMTFVGTRPEVPRYVDSYTDEMRATLLLPAGITSMASICYKDEDRLYKEAADMDQVYIEEVLPEKMKWNLKEIAEFNLVHELSVMVQTVLCVIR